MEFDRAKGVDAIAACAWGVAVIGGYICYRYKLRDMVPLAITVMNVCVILLTLIGRVLFSGSRDKVAGLFLLFALIILGIVTGAIFCVLLPVTLVHLYRATT